MKKSHLKLFLKKIITEAKLLENIQDPSKDEMFEYLRQMYGNEEGFRDDAEVAIYWFANFYHGGQSSNLYSALSTSRFSPGPIAKGPEPQSSEEMMYQDLVLRFAPGSEDAIEIEKKQNSLNEALSPKNQTLIEKWIKELGARKAAYKIINSIVRQRTGIDIEDMADTATLSSGLDTVEQYLNTGNFEEALKAGLRAAKEFFDEEAGEGLFEGDETHSDDDFDLDSQRNDGEKQSRKVDINIGKMMKDPSYRPSPFGDKQTSKKFFGASKKPVQDFDWEKIKSDIDKGTLSEGVLQSLAAALMLGTAGFNTPVVKNLMHNPQGQQVVMKVKQAWGSMPQAQRTVQKAQELWNKAMSPRKFANPNQPLPDEAGMNAYDLGNKYSNRNDDVAQKASGFVKKYVSGQVKESSEQVIYKDRQGGQDVYWMDNKDTGGKIHVKPEAVQKLIKRGHRLVDLQDVNEENTNGETSSLIDGQSNIVAASKVNKILSELSKGIFSDDSWQAVNKIFEKLKASGLDYNILSAKYGGQQDTSNGMPKYKEWQISIPFTNKVGKPMELVGQITAHGAGSVEQPLDRYDITAYVSAIPKRA